MLRNLREYRNLARGLVLGALGALLVASVGACGGDDPTPTPKPKAAAPAATATPVPGLIDSLYAGAKAEGEVIWATTDTEKRTAAMIEAFEQAYPGVKVKLITGTSADLTEKLFLEAQANKVSVDVTDPGRDNRVVDQGLAEDLTDIIEELGVDPTTVYSDNRVWLKVGVPHGPICNTKRLSPSEFPKSYEDLLDPRFKGEIVVENRLKGFIYLTNLPEYGNSRPDLWSEDRIVDFLSKVKANDLRAHKGNSTVGDLVASGEVTCALEINISSFNKLHVAGAPVAMVPVKVLSVEPVHHFVPKNSPNPNAAKLFAAFLMGPEGKALWTQVRVSSDLGLVEDTEYAKMVKALGSKIVAPGTEMNDHFKRLTKVYRTAIGIPTG